MIVQRECVVCDSPYVCHLRDVPTRWTKKLIPLYFCMECRSFFNPSGNHDIESSFKSGLDWSISVEERNRQWSSSLLDELGRKITFGSIIEIGCGIGTFLHTAHLRQMNVVGFETNPLAVEYGRNQYGIDLRTEFWDSKTLDSTYDLIVSISVMEHLEQPRELFREISDYCRTHHSAVFLSVPFLDFDRWHYIFDPDPLQEGTPFFDNDSHVTHFSRQGFTLMCKQFGATAVTPLTGGSWSGFLVEF